VAPKPAAGEPPSANKPEELADAWLDSLGKRDLESLTRQTRLPFTLHELECEKNCASSRATDPASLALLVNCMGEHTLFIDDLAVGENRSPTEEKHVGKGFPRWARRWTKEIGSELTPIALDVFGNGLTHELIVLVGADGVHRCGGTLRTIQTRARLPIAPAA
jgi:hypothetical protein